MKKILLLFICVLLSLTIFGFVNAQTLRLSVANQQVSGSNFIFEVWMQATSGTVYLAATDIVLRFNSGNFTSPVDTKGAATTFVLNNSNGDNTTSLSGPVGALYRSNVNPASITSNEIIINVNALAPGNQDDFNSDVAKIDNNPYHFGTYTISGITNPTGTMGLTWKTSGTGVFTKAYTFANTNPWNQTQVTLDTVHPADHLLPVQMTSFIGVAKGNNVQLTWKTATEVKSSTFEIERRTTSDWKKIGERKAAGTSNAPREYTYTDNMENIGGSKILYRLKTVDNDGSFTYSSEVEVVAIPTAYGLENNFPNPFNPQTKIQYSLPENAKVRLAVYDMLGRQVAELVNEEQNAGYYEKTFTGSNLSSGMYIYRITAQAQGKNAFTKVKKMLLVK